MADDYALTYRRNRSTRASGGAAVLTRSFPILAIAGLVLGAAAASLAGLSPGALLTGARPLPSPPASAARTITGPRIISTVPGVKQIETGSAFGLPTAGNRPLSQVYLPVGPVFLRFESHFVEVDGPKLYPPPLGNQRGESRLLDHAMVLANVLRPLGYTPCDQHLRYVAAANITLFIAGFMPLRTPVPTEAAANLAFWQRPETSAVRRVVQDLAERGAIGLADFGRDTSPVVKGLFQPIRQVQPACG